MNAPAPQTLSIEERINRLKQRQLAYHDIAIHLDRKEWEQAFKQAAAAGISIEDNPVLAQKLRPYLEQVKATLEREKNLLRSLQSEAEKVQLATEKTEAVVRKLQVAQKKQEGLSQADEALHRLDSEGLAEQIRNLDTLDPNKSEPGFQVRLSQLRHDLDWLKGQNEGALESARTDPAAWSVLVAGRPANASRLAVLRAAQPTALVANRPVEADPHQIYQAAFNGLASQLKNGQIAPLRQRLSQLEATLQQDDKLDFSQKLVYRDALSTWKRRADQWEALREAIESATKLIATAAKPTPETAAPIETPDPKPGFLDRLGQWSSGLLARVMGQQPAIDNHSAAANREEQLVRRQKLYQTISRLRSRLLESSPEVLLCSDGGKNPQTLAERWQTVLAEAAKHFLSNEKALTAKDNKAQWDRFNDSFDRFLQSIQSYPPQRQAEGESFFKNYGLAAESTAALPAPTLPPAAAPGSATDTTLITPSPIRPVQPEATSNPIFEHPASFQSSRQSVPTIELKPLREQVEAASHQPIPITISLKEAGKFGLSRRVSLEVDNGYLSNSANSPPLKKFEIDVRPYEEKTLWYYAGPDPGTAHVKAQFDLSGQPIKGETTITLKPSVRS